jgi:hypothetical protein
MTLDEFTRYAETWGADIARWPERLRTEAMQLAASPQGATILRRERALDTILHAGAQEVTQARIDRAIQRVVTTLAAERPRPRLANGWSRWLIPAAGLACAVGIGALAATIGPLADSGAEDAPSVLTMILDMNSLGQGFAL